MTKRNNLTLSVLAALVLPLGAGATDYRETNPQAWTAHTVNDAVQALYGDVKLIESGDVHLKMPTVSSQGGAVPVSIKTDIDAKSVSLFQDANPESAVAVWNVLEGGVVNYNVKLKLKTIEKGVPSTVTVVVEGKDGHYYTANASVVVAGGCE